MAFITLKNVKCGPEVLKPLQNRVQSILSGIGKRSILTRHCKLVTGTECNCTQQQEEQKEPADYCFVGDRMVRVPNEFHCDLPDVKWPRCELLNRPKGSDNKYGTCCVVVRVVVC